MYIRENTYRVYSSFVKQYCPKHIWCKDCKYYYGKCTHEKHPKISLWTEGEEPKEEK